VANDTGDPWHPAPTHDPNAASDRPHTIDDRDALCDNTPSAVTDDSPDLVGPTSWSAARLTCAGRGTRPPTFGPALVGHLAISAPGGPFIIYLASGPRRTGDFTQQLAAAGTDVSVVLVDTCLGGPAHDIRDPDVLADLVALASRPDCVAVLASPPCKSFSVLQFAEGNRPYRDLAAPDGNVTAGVLDPCTAEGNAVLAGCARIAQAAFSHNAAIIFENPVPRAARPHAIPGRERHASAWDSPIWRRLVASSLGDHYVDFHQCSLQSPSSALRGPQKATRLACDERTLPALRRRFAHCQCDGSHEHAPVKQPRLADGSWASAKSELFSP
jgi:hypothetical protein